VAEQSPRQTGESERLVLAVIDALDQRPLEADPPRVLCTYRRRTSKEPEQIASVHRQQARRSFG
jgi:hypothetical protein